VYSDLELSIQLTRLSGRLNQAKVSKTGPEWLPCKRGVVDQNPYWSATLVKIMEDGDGTAAHTFLSNYFGHLFARLRSPSAGIMLQLRYLNILYGSC